jgi:lipopolysaccharide export LptBFGC system permease protein LptF
MRILDRYVISAFLKNYLISFFVLVGMYVVLDMVFNFEDFVPTQATSGSSVETLLQTILAVGDYYFYQSFLIFVHLSGVIPVVAAAFTLIRLSRQNELTAIMASGVPLLRVAAPVIGVAVLLNALLLVNTEFIIPQMIPKLTRKQDDVVSDVEWGKTYPVHIYAKNGQQAVVAYKFTPPTATTPPKMDGLDVVFRDASFNPTEELFANTATWDSSTNHWRLTGGVIDTLDTSSKGKEKRVVKESHAFVYEDGITPDDIANRHKRELKAYPIKVMQDQDRDLLIASKFMPPTEDAPAAMDDLTVIFRNPDTLDPTSMLIADEATWNAKSQSWDLLNAKQVFDLMPGEKSAKPDQPQGGYQSNISPDEIALFHSREFVELLPTRKINEILRGPTQYGTLDLQRAKNFRFTQPLINVILLLLAIPCVLLREPGQIKTSAMKCLFLVGQCMGCVFLAQQLAGQPPLASSLTPHWPALMAWMPVFLFGPMSIWLLERVKT